MAQGGKREFTITRIWMNIPIHMDDHLPGHPLTNEVPLITIGTLGFGLLPLSFEAGKACKLRTLRFDYHCPNFTTVEFHFDYTAILVVGGSARHHGNRLSLGC